MLNELLLLFIIIFITAITINEHYQSVVQSEKNFVCAYYCVQLSYTTQHGTILILFPLNSRWTL